MPCFPTAVGKTCLCLLQTENICPEGDQSCTVASDKIQELSTSLLEKFLPLHLGSGFDNTTAALWQYSILW